MEELGNWLSQQHNGLQTYKAFQQRVSLLLTQDRDHAALFYLLASIVGRFIDTYEEHPLPVDVADEAFKKLRDLVQRAAQTMKGPAAGQIKLLNEIASGEDLG